MTTITISRQLGSMGCDISREVAEILGYTLVWRELINQAAKDAGAPEMALATIDELGLLNIKPSQKKQNAYKNAVRQIMLDLAKKDNVVIIGRAGQVILAEKPNTLHIRLVAPLEIRAARLSKRHKISLESARAQIEASDKNRSEYLHRYYHVEWNDPMLYHMVINTGITDRSAAAQLICKAAQLITSPIIESQQQFHGEYIDCSS